MKAAIYLLACLVTILIAGCANAAGLPSRVASDGETLVSATAGALSVQVRILTSEVHVSKVGQKTLSVRSRCTLSKNPCSAVDHLEISVNGDALFIPRSAYCGLSDLSTAQIQIGGDLSVLIVHGGDASESYIARIEFDSAQVKRRTLFSALSEKQPLEETIYHLVEVGD